MVARVAAVLHQSLGELMEMDVEDLLAWDEEARRLASQLGRF